MGWMEDLLHPELPSSNETKPRHKRLWGTLIFFALLLVFLVFSFKVFGYYKKIQNGTFDVSQLSFATTAASGARLAGFAAAAPGSGELATQDDPSLGSPDAPLTIVEFADFGCPYSKEVSYIVRALAKQYPEKVRFIYRDFPLDDLHPGATLAAQAGECAQDQNSFWEMHDVMFRDSGEFTPDVLLEDADEAGLDSDDFAHCMAYNTYTEEVATDLADGVAAGVVGTPTFFFNGQKVEGAIPFSIFNELITTFLALP
jgi:protein-disulfide isomerase